MACWLMKCEPSVYSIDDLQRDKSTCWEGVRNYQARNFMRDDMKIGDRVLFYHSNADPSGITGLAEIVKTSYPDKAALDKSSRYYDPKSTPDKPIWFMVDVGFVARFSEMITLEQIKNDSKLDGILVAKRGQRLSIQPVSDHHYQHICRLAGQKI